MIQKPIYRVLIVGVSSYLGSALAFALRDHYEVFGTYHEHPLRIEGVTSVHMNCKNGGEIVDIVKRFTPDAVLYCAGLSSRNIEQVDPSLAETLNFKAPTVFFRVVTFPPYFIYFSDDEALMPNNVVAKTKEQGENSVLGQRQNTLVLRVGHLYGESTGGLSCHKMSWSENVKQKLERQERVDLSIDRYHAFTYLGDVARAVKLVLTKPPAESQLYNLAGPDLMSAHDFGKALAKKFGLPDTLVAPRKTSLEPEKLVMDSSKFTTTYPLQFKSIADGLHEYSERLRCGTPAWV